MSAYAGIKIDPRTLKTVITLLTGAAAAKALENSAEAKVVYEEQDKILQQLRSQGLTEEAPAIYSLYFSLNGDASSVYWADILNKPDIITLVQIEGQGNYLVPDIANEYAGQPFLETIVNREAPAGRRIIVHVLDDDSFSNAIWNNLLQTRVNFSLRGEGGAVAAQAMFRADVEANGHIQLLDKNMTIDTYDYIATAEFIVPTSPDGRWVADGVLHDSKGRTVGSLRLAQLWRPIPTRPLIEDAVGKRGAAFGKFVFWGVLGVVLLAVVVKLLASKDTKANS